MIKSLVQNLQELSNLVLVIECSAKKNVHLSISCKAEAFCLHCQHPNIVLIMLISARSGTGSPRQRGNIRNESLDELSAWYLLNHRSTVANISLYLIWCMYNACFHGFGSNTSLSETIRHKKESILSPEIFKSYIYVSFEYPSFTRSI